MKKLNFPTLFLIATLITFLPGCQAIGDVFKAGMWTGILVVVIIVGLILYLISRAGKNNN
jgi:cytosine/uracil/thiamine/allantoin permease